MLEGVLHCGGAKVFQKGQVEYSLGYQASIMGKGDIMDPECSRGT